MFLCGDMRLPSSSSPKFYLSPYGRLGEMLAMLNASMLMEMLAMNDKCFYE